MFPLLFPAVYYVILVLRHVFFCTEPLSYEMNRLYTTGDVAQVLLPAEVCFSRHRDELGYPFGGFPRSPTFIPREEAGFLVVGAWAPK